MLTAERLRHLLSYDSLSGEFRWLHPSSTKMKRGALAGCIGTGGYRMIRVEGRMYRAHRLAWLYMTGAWPVDLIDHRDMRPDNNAWANLRHADKSLNACNRTAQSNSQTGIKGVSRRTDNGRWTAHICRDGKQKNLGSFATEEEAQAAYAAAASAVHGDFARAA